MLWPAANYRAPAMTPMRLLKLYSMAGAMPKRQAESKRLSMFSAMPRGGVRFYAFDVSARIVLVDEIDGEYPLASDAVLPGRGDRLHRLGSAVPRKPAFVP